MRVKEFPRMRGGVTCSEKPFAMHIGATNPVRPCKYYFLFNIMIKGTLTQWYQ